MQYTTSIAFFFWLPAQILFGVTSSETYTNDLDSHIIVYQSGYYSIDNTVVIDVNNEKVLSFPNTSSSNPFRVSVYSGDARDRSPALVVIRQEKQVLSWQIPMMVSSFSGVLRFWNTSRTLCYSSIGSVRRKLKVNTSQYNTVSKRNFSVSVSTSSELPITVTIRADEVEDYYIHDDQIYTVTVSPSEPVFYYYNFPQDEQYSRAFVYVTSEDDVCLMVSVQDSLCPVKDLNQDIKFEGKYQTVNLKGGMIVSERNYPNGFFLVFVAMGDNYECTQESSILPMPRSQRRAINFLNRSSQIQFSIKQAIPAEEYFSAILVVMLANVGFCIVFISIIAIFYCCRRDKMDEIDSDEIDGNDPSICASEDEIIDHYLEREQLTVQDFCAKRMQRKTFNYFWHITNIAIFYGIPVMQLMVAYQRMVNMTGDLDRCYHNFMCAHPLGEVSDFNHIYSNIGYMILGIFFLCVTLFKQHKHVYVPKCGIPKNYGIFYAMGVALMVEGILSACYHICPNQSNYQFDTSFMYIMAVLCIVQLYQNRHPRINASAYATFTILGIAVFMAMLGILTNSTTIMIIFVISYLVLCVFLSFKIYFFGYVIFGLVHFFDTVKDRADLKKAVMPIRKGRFVLLGIANILNLSMAILGIIFYPSRTDFGTYLLAILMINALLHAIFYISMKLYNKERICVEACLYGFFALICWAFSSYFFLNGSTLWTVTPAESRQLNTDCVFMNFYDNHDLWHLLSAPGMFFIFMLLMHLDDDLTKVPRNQIKVF